MATPKSLKFATSKSSPFPDGYDIDAERTKVAHLLDADEPDPADAEYPRYVLYTERLRQLELMQQEQNLRQRADRTSNPESQQVNAIGGLAAEEEDIAVLHTREAMRLFLGRQAQTGERGAHSVVGGRRVAAGLRQLWALSSGDNPYADFALVEFDERAAQVKQQLENLAQHYMEMLNQRRAMGLKYSVLQSQQPAEVKLNFRSPYGFAVVELVCMADYAIRVIKSAKHRNIIDDAEARRATFNAQNFCRSVFERVVQFQRLLSREELRPLTRADYLTTGDELAAKRLQAVTELFGVCPRDILLKERRPKHTRSLNLSAAEFAALSAVPNVDETANGMRDQVAAGLV
jgi:integrating conjugative element protein (TIGR03761 family)